MSQVPCCSVLTNKIFTSNKSKLNITAQLIRLGHFWPAREFGHGRTSLILRLPLVLHTAVTFSLLITTSKSVYLRLGLWKPIPMLIPEASEEVPSVHLSVETTINIYPPASDTIRLSLEILSFLKQNGLVSTPNHSASAPRNIFLMISERPLIK